MRILGIETSCDETACAVVEDGTRVLSSVIASSADMHAKTGGIIPEQAARRQVESIIPVIQQALEEALGNPKLEYRNSKQITNHKSQTPSKLPNHQINKSLVDKVDAIAVTYGPGLIGSLLVGVETAKTLSLVWDKPLIKVNHLVAHIYANFVSDENKKQGTRLQQLCCRHCEQAKNKQITNCNIQHSKFYIPKFPALALVVSGGHTDLVMMESHGSIKWIGGTRDDAAGEAFDKTARLLGLPYPGGPAISKSAEKYFSEITNQKVKGSLTKFPRPMIHDKNYEWSFSGLKTAVLNDVKKNDSVDVLEYSAEIQESIVDVLVEKSVRAIKEFAPKSFLLSGGVAANKRLREKFKLKFEKDSMEINFHVPQIKYCTDNAVAISSCAYFNQDFSSWRDLIADPELTITGES